MTSPTPTLLDRSRRRTKQVTIGCGVAVAVALAWALVPPHPATVEVPSLVVASDTSELPRPAPLDIHAFETPVWTIAAAPQPPAPSPAPTPPPPPLKLQLIGIIREEDIYKAVLYDPDTNKLFVVASGQDAAGHTVDRVAADSVNIKDGSLVRTLALKTGGGA